jgi:hypothetical protein
MFVHNVGGIDRALRVTLGAVFFLAGLILLTSKIRPGVILAVLGLLALLTGILRYCVLYVPFGISTARPERSRLSQACDCAAWMKAMQDNRTAVAPPACAEEKDAEVTTTARGR